MRNLEIEAKFQINDADWKRLKEKADVRQCREQLNVYYACKGIEVEGTTFRVRYVAGSLPKVTFKIPQRVEGGQRESVEYECPFERKRLAGRELESQDLPAALEKVLSELGVSSLERVGWMRTERWVVEFPGAGNAELDRVALPNGDVFYEVEVEGGEDSVRHRTIAFILAEAKSAQPSKCSKFERFLAARQSTMARGL